LEGAIQQKTVGVRKLRGEEGSRRGKNEEKGLRERSVTDSPTEKSEAERKEG